METQDSHDIMFFTSVCKLLTTTVFTRFWLLADKDKLAVFKQEVQKQPQEQKGLNTQGTNHRTRHSWSEAGTGKEREHKDWLTLKTTRVRQATNKANKDKHQTGVPWKIA